MPLGMCADMYLVNYNEICSSTETVTASMYLQLDCEEVHCQLIMCCH